MALSPTTELEGLLQEMLHLKPPGVSGSKITKATKLCSDNVKSESVLVQKMYTHFKKAPATHKLGALYVVDSVTRRWLEHAKTEGQAVNGQAKDGTFAAAVHRVTELMPVLINDIIASAPEPQKEKIKKLFDIWDKGQTFPSEMIKNFREKLAAPAPIQESTTPKHSPPPDLVATYGPAATEAKPAVPNSMAIMEALANMARQNTSAAAAAVSIAPGMSNGPTTAQAPIPAATPAPVFMNGAGTYGVLPQQSVPPSYPAPSHAATPMPAGMPYGIPSPSNPTPPAVNGANSLASILSGLAMPGMAPPSAQPAAHALPPPPSAPAPAQAAPPGLDPNAQRQLFIIQTLIAQGVPFDQIPALMQTMSAVLPPPAAPPIAGQPQPQPQPQPQFPGIAPIPHGGSWPIPLPPPMRVEGSRDGLRSPTYRGRSRSRSPGRRGWDNRDSPRGSGGGGHDRFGEYGHERDSRRGDYRQRSPTARRGRSQTPPKSTQRDKKLVEYDRTLPRDHIKVLSRTLFVGGVTCSEAELRSIFSRHGEVQTCIVNRDKRHAFVKMTNRKDAETAKAAMDRHRSADLSLRTRWGVGFGPRDCSDFNSGPEATGTSIIPIHKLTDADRKWMLTAEYGGSGGKPIEHGLVVEEPDIEIGAGVSSKAISRRMPTGKGAGGEVTGGNGGGGSVRRFQGNEDREEERDASGGAGGGGWGGQGRRGASRRDDDPAVGAVGKSPMLGFPYNLGGGYAQQQ